ncbi:7-cyano-7-deazaguanine synthase [Methylocystis parvus]|uniref:7-cyano-7-deazaguanine synthase n=1 Tax=Methylocystis parvus TaxID=134 RepID=A0A6B8M4J1_9HYPH|nr:7-cyano-7-deazaguanine synthase [Methylocystis parvus]QGM99937.1 7-cyano-7-deazaguanine synthase [Methylocystis parvus]WBK02358.1 7-cyano-7-deazaguanine synthase [Methylocystis parvus OBBP]
MRALLLSGGMDSVAIAYWQRPEVAVTIDYGQRPAAGEIRAASVVAGELGIRHLVLRLDQLGLLGSGDLAGAPKLDIAPKPEWWPFRNQLLVTVAAGAVLPLGARKLLIGALRTDGHHVDGRREFVEALSCVLQMQEGNMSLDAPAIDLDGVELIRKSQIPMSLLAWSHSCHKAEHACGECGGCRKHYRTFEALGELPY